MLAGCINVNHIGTVGEYRRRDTQTMRFVHAFLHFACMQSNRNACVCCRDISPTFLFYQEKWLREGGHHHPTAHSLIFRKKEKRICVARAMLYFVVVVTGTAAAAYSIMVAIIHFLLVVQRTCCVHYSESMLNANHLEQHSIFFG